LIVDVDVEFGVLQKATVRLYLRGSGMNSAVMAGS